jgi:hypothetical protein
MAPNPTAFYPQLTSALNNGTIKWDDAIEHVILFTIVQKMSGK